MNRWSAGFLVAAAWSGCSHEAVVDLTVAVDPSVPAAVVAAVQRVELDVRGLFTRSSTTQLSRPFAAGGSERLVILSPIAGEVTLDLTARDSDGVPLLAGMTTLTLRTGVTRAQSLTVQLAGGGDGGGDGGLGPALDAGTDFATTASADLAGGADLGVAGCPPGVLLCDGFEGGSVDTSLWDDAVTQSNASVTVDQTHVHRGHYALHVHTNVVAASGSAEASVGEAHTFSPPGATFWVRAFYYFPSNASSAVATLFDATQKVSPFDDVALAIDHDALAIYNAFNGGSYVASSTPLLPLDVWTCLEWQVDTGSPNQLHAWVDGQPVAALNLTQPTTAAQPIGLFSIGLGIFPPNTSPIGLDAWIDDVIFDHASIGCAK